MNIFSFLTRRRSCHDEDSSTGNVALFSRPCGAEVPRLANGLPSPNSAAGELVRRYLQARVGNLNDIAAALGRDPKRIYREAEGEAVLSWDYVDRAATRLPLAERLALGRFLMDRWGLRVEVGQLPGIVEQP